MERERGRKTRQLTGSGTGSGCVSSPMPGTGNDLTGILKRHACILSPRGIPGRGYKGKLVQVENLVFSMEKDG